jgi:hypothetical protein
MRPVDIGIDAARELKRGGPGQVCAVFAHALYLRVPGGMVVVTTTQEHRGPLHVRLPRLPAVAVGCPVAVEATSLWIGSDRYGLDAPTWSPSLPATSTLDTAARMARHWLPDLGTTLDIGSAPSAGLPVGALDALRGGRLVQFAAMVSGRGPGLTPAGDDTLAGVLLVARARGGSADVALRCVRSAATNDITRAFLGCAALGRCIEPAHDLLAALAHADHRGVGSAVANLRRFGSSSGAALAYGIRTALLELPDLSGPGSALAVVTRRSAVPGANVPDPGRRWAPDMIKRGQVKYICRSHSECCHGHGS